MMTERVNMITKRYGLVLAALLIVAQMVVAPVAAEICYSRTCFDGDWNCRGCSYHGQCIGFNYCGCAKGWGGKECSVPDFCGSGTEAAMPINATCSGNCSYDARYGLVGAPATYSWIYQKTGDGICSAMNSSSGVCYCADDRTGTCCDQYKQGTLSPSALNFSSITVGAVAVAQANITYFTPLTRSNMTVETIALGGTNAGDFALGSGTCAANTNVTASGNCTIPVSFTPTATGIRSATLTVTTQEPDGTNPQTLTTTLTGTGITTVSSILVDPLTPTTIFAGLDGAGIYRSTNSGGVWSVTTLLSGNTRIKALAITPGDSTKLFAATYGGGVYKSTDSGMSWSACTNTGLTNTNVLSLVINSAGRLYAGTEAGVFSSTDSCTSWTALNSGLP
jgi:hypothetical protein